MSDTPRTKEAARMGFIEGDMLRSVFVVPLKVAEELERDLATRTAERDALAAELAAMQKQRDEADAECREANASWCREIEESIDLNRELASMREQRDEARREVCELRAVHYKPSFKRHIAADRGWDCFEEAKR